MSHIDKWQIWDRSILSSEFPKQYDSLFLYSSVLKTWNCSGRSANQNKNNFTFASLTKPVSNKQTVVLLWKFWRKYGYVSYLFSCKKHDRKISWYCGCIKIRMLFHNLFQPVFDGVAWCWPRDKSEKMTCLECLRN